MTLLLFAYTDSQGLYQEASCGHENFEVCLDMLSELINQGFSLNRVYLIQGNQQVEMPVEAFDGHQVGYMMRSLQEQWETILC